MPTTHDPAIVLTDVTLDWPDGSRVLDHASATFGPGRTGLLGANGIGKSTLLALIAGDLTPTSGSIGVTGTVGRLEQGLTLHVDATVADLLGIREKRDALRAIESGDADPRHFAILADDWDVDARARALLDDAGLSSLGLDRRVGTLSGGQAMLTALTGLRMRGDDVVLLDEPTNDLDRVARHAFYDVIRRWRGVLVVVSHDVALLDIMDESAELRSGALTVYGGNHTAFRAHLAREQAAAEQALRAADQRLRVEKRQQIEAQTKLDRRRRYARTDFENKRRPKIIMKQRKSDAQVSAGKLRGELDEKVEAARREVQDRTARVRRDAHIRIALPDPGVPAGRRLAELRDTQGAGIIVQGPERVALTGRNGVGKTRLLESLVHGGEPLGGPASAVRCTERIGYMPQRRGHLDDAMSVLDTVCAAAPGTPPEQIRAQLARFLFGADAIGRPVGDLSGGERFRVALARLLLADPPNQLLVLDEPTNDLDLDSVDELVSALGDYRGGLIVVSHDDAFLDRLGVDVCVEMHPEGLSVNGRRPTPCT